MSTTGTPDFRMMFTAEEVLASVTKQVKSVCPLALRGGDDPALLGKAVDRAIERVAHCLSFNGNKYVRRDGVTVFDPLHSGQYLIFLYYLSNTLFAEFQAPSLAAGVYNLNRALHCADLYYEVALPSVFYVSHPIGCVMGRATYGDFFQFRQNCTVGGSNRIYPVIGRNVLLWAGSSIIGNCRIGDNVVLSAGAMVKDQDVPDNSLVFGQTPNLTIKSRPREFFSRPDSFEAVDCG